MEAPMLKRRLNPFLLASTVLVLSLLAGLSVMYQGQLSDLLSEKKSLNEKLEQKNQRISNLQAEKANLSQKLSNKNEDIDTYLSENQKLKNQKNQLESQVDSLESEKSSLETEIDDLETELEDTQDTLTLVNNSLGEICTDSDNNLTDDGDQCTEWNHDLDAKHFEE